MTFQSSDFNCYDIEDGIVDEEMNDVIRRIPSPVPQISRDFAYKPRKVSFKKYLKDINERDDSKKNFMQSKSVCKSNHSLYPHVI